jgi:two-component system nitrate/nitrite response regulator NarL
MQAQRSGMTTERECVVTPSVQTIIVERHTLVREGLASLLHDSRFKVVSTVATLHDLSPLPPASPGLLLVGLSNGALDHLRILDKNSPVRQDYKVVVVADQSGQPGRADIPQILASGADGYVLNIQSRAALLKSLELVFLGARLFVLGDNRETADMPKANGTSVAPGDVPERNATLEVAQAALSERELEVLGCLACGVSNKHIARSCQIAESTVKIHLKSILRKINVQNRTQAAIWAIENGARCKLHRNGRGGDARAPLTGRATTTSDALPATRRPS